MRGGFEQLRDVSLGAGDSLLQSARLPRHAVVVVLLLRLQQSTDSALASLARTPRSPARIIKVTTHTRSIDVCIVPVLCETQQEIPGFPTASFSLRCTWLGLARRPGKGRWSRLPMNTIQTGWGARIKITTAVHITMTNDWRLRICSTSSYHQSCTYYQISYMHQYNVDACYKY